MATQQRAHFESLTQMERARHELRDGSDVDVWVDRLVRAAAAVDATAPRGQVRRDARLERSFGTAEDREMAAAQTTGIDVRMNLRRMNVPTAYLHVFEPESEPLVTVEIQNHTGHVVRMCVESWVEGYSARAAETVEVPAGTLVRVHQLPTFFPAPLESVREATRATLHVKVDELAVSRPGRRSEELRTFRIWLLPRTTAILLEPDPSSGELRDLRPYLACWVTPNADDVMTCVRAAAPHAPQGSIVGYQTDASGVGKQIEALYGVLRQREIRYVNSVSMVGGGAAAAQRIRLPRESLASRSANCIDGTVLLASLIEAASMHAGIVVIPGHAFLAWQTTEGGDWDFLETTLLGSQEFALEVARQTVARVHAEHLPCTILDVAELRGQGFFPLE